VTFGGTPRFHRRVVLVTGATSGLGRACAVRLAGEGAAVGVLGRDPLRCKEIVEEIGWTGGAALAIEADLHEPGAADAAVGALLERWGRLDGAVNAAGVSPAPRAVDEVSDDLWNETIDLDLSAVFRCLRAQIRAMAANGAGAIVNVASYAATTVQVAGISPYAAAKWGVIGLTRAAARDYARSGVRVNAFAPGHVRTPMIDRNLRDGGEQRLSERIPLGRIAEPAEMAGVVAFLLCDDAAFITGQTLVADGGLSI
jgi:NAD(P)-dependent dehydrogenase (short-subunit alcohol dehydrogenase family)